MIDQATLDFLRELKVNNNKEWFDKNRKRYDAVKADYLSLAETILDSMKKVDPMLEMTSAKDCIFRINRDVRFSADKSPYKTNLGIALHAGNKKFNLAAYYLHIEPDGSSFAGGGMWMPEAPLLASIRREIHNFYPDLRAILDDPGFIKTYGTLDVEEGQKLTRPPKGYDENDPAIEYLKLKSFTASATVPAEILTTDKFLPFVIKTLTALKPFIGFLNRGLRSDAEGGL
jgi:uncharacterized protein (TIGR02453 family)